MNAKTEMRINSKIGKLQAKEMMQVANEKTLAKNLSTTRQKLVNLQHYDVEDLKKVFVKHVNFCAKKRLSTLVGFDATAIKKSVTNEDLENCIDERGLNVVKCLSLVIGNLDKQAKKTQKELEKQAKKQS
jgi:hypothetical protein